MYPAQKLSPLIIKAILNIIFIELVSSQRNPLKEIILNKTILVSNSDKIPIMLNENESNLRRLLNINTKLYPKNDRPIEETNNERLSINRSDELERDSLNSSLDDLQSTTVNYDNKINEINQNFLSLFDDLWRIKQSSADTLKRLEYFNQTNNKNNSNRGSTNCLNQRNCSEQNYSRFNHDQAQNPTLFAKFQSKFPIGFSDLPQQPFDGLIINNRLPSLIGNSQQYSNRLMSNWPTDLSNWMARINEKILYLITKITRNIYSQARPMNQINHQTTILQTYKDDEEDDGQVKMDDQLRIRRQLLVANEQNRVKIKQPDCGDLEVKCHSIESLVDENLNNSFPGTLLAIEDNCRHIAYLLGNCWPQQLMQLKASLISWNESLKSFTDFPLPSDENHLEYPEKPVANKNILTKQQSATDCNIQPQTTSPLVLDRISWMWLNLCMDRNFRKNYVENLKCLSFWNQERAQTVCSNEYRRMQVYLIVSDRNKLVAKDAQRATRDGERNPGNSKKIRHHRLETPLKLTNGLAVESETNSDDEKNDMNRDRELGSKTLCCLFDQFLRCVNRQALRDCGQTGAQFVVDFMSRIGTDDMKFLCNGDPMNSQQQQQQQRQQLRQINSKLINSFDKGPFIENDYCGEPSIQAAMQEPINQMISDRNRHQPSKSPNRNQLINHDPTYFGTDSTLSNSPHSTRPDLIMLISYSTIIIIVRPLLKRWII